VATRDRVLTFACSAFFAAKNRLRFFGST